MVIKIAGQSSKFPMEGVQRFLANNVCVSNEVGGCEHSMSLVSQWCGECDTCSV